MRNPHSAWDRSVSVGGRNIYYLRYVDETILFVTAEEEIVELINSVRLQAGSVIGKLK